MISDNDQVPSTNNQIITNDQITMSKRFLKIEQLELIWNLGFGYWNLIQHD